MSHVGRGPFAADAKLFASVAFEELAMGFSIAFQNLHLLGILVNSDLEGSRRVKRRSGMFRS